jgi:hypothetical protein
VSTPRCPVRGCPVRYRGGPDRLCPGHQADHDDTGQPTRAALLAAPAADRPEPPGNHTERDQP